MQATKERSNYQKLVEICLLALAMFASKQDVETFRGLASLCRDGYMPAPASWQGRFSPEGRKILKSIFRTCGLL